jgi:hypothetical protein
MEQTHDSPHEANLPGGTMVRDHWSNWSGFTHLIKAGIVVCGLVALCAVLFITGATLWAFLFLALAIVAAAFFALFR